MDCAPGGFAPQAPKCMGAAGNLSAVRAVLGCAGMGQAEEKVATRSPGQIHR